MSDYPNLRRLAEVTIFELGNPSVELLDGEPRHLATARALLAALDLAQFAPDRDGYCFRQQLDALEKEAAQ